MTTKPITYGPTWEKNLDGTWKLPKHTLGWSVIEWSSEVLLQPDGPDAGSPWRWTDEQARFLLWWYAVDEYGRFVYRRGVFRRLKGHGKDPVAAAIAIIEFIGPCRFGGWDDAGEPIAIPHPAPWIQVVGTTATQTRTTFNLFPGFFGSKRRAQEFGVDLGIEIIHGPGSSRIEVVTSSPRSVEGARPSLVLMLETQHWVTSNSGREMARAIARNLAKSRDGAARSLALTNAHEPGEDSVGEADWDAFMSIRSGKSRATGLLYDSLEAPDETSLKDIDSLRAGLIAARGDSVWLDVERLIEEIMDPTTPVSMSNRFYLNKIVASDDAYVSPSEWGRCRVEDSLEQGDTIAMFFDGSQSSDHSGLVACRIEDGLLSVLGHWDPSQETDGVIDRDKVNRRVADAFEVYDVVAFYADVRFWESEVDRWRDLYSDTVLVKASAMVGGKKSHAINWDMRPPGRQREFTESVDKFLALTLSGTIRHDGNPALAQHMANAKRQQNRYGFSIRKEERDSPRKIDLAVCAIGASKARWDVQATGVLEKRVGAAGGSVYAF